jgi:hypothetical protein
MSSLDLELTTVSRRWCIRQPRQADSLATASPRFPEEPASLLKQLVKMGKATDHGAAPAPGTIAALVHHHPAGRMEETSMS